MIRLWPSRLMFVVGETVPMPPVFGPWSPSSARLWSWTEAMGTTRAPSEKTRNDTSSPCRNSSITTFAPAEPNLFSPMICSTTVFASATSWTTTVPLPAARPSAFTTNGIAERGLLHERERVVERASTPRSGARGSCAAS